MPIGKTQLYTATSDSANITGGPATLMGILLSANSANLDCQLVDLATDDSSDKLVFNVLDGDCKYFDFTPISGVVFGTSITVDIQGSGGQVTLFVS